VQLIYNGNTFDATSDFLPLNRAFNFGDGLFETIRILNGEILFLSDHIQRLHLGMNALQLQGSERFTPFFLHKQIIELSRINQVTANGRVRITIFRHGAGFYEPTTNETDYVLTCQPLASGYDWNESSYTVGLYTGIAKNVSAISSFKTLSSLCYVMAALHRKQMNWHDCLISNSEGRIADATSSNVFFIEGENVYSPPVRDGGVDGIMRKRMIELLKKNGIYFEEKSISANQLSLADEIFLTNVIFGIQPVTSFEGKNRLISFTKKIFDSIITDIFPA